MRSLAFVLLLLSVPALRAETDLGQTLWARGDGGVACYRIPALVTAPDGTLIAACDARQESGADLYGGRPIRIVVRRSADDGRTWSASAASWACPWNDAERWSFSDPSLVVDRQAGKVFLFVNAWENLKGSGIYRFFVQESADSGRTWSAPREISSDIAFPEWPFGKPDRSGGFIFISSGSGCQLADGTLLHTLVHVGDGNALFGSSDHGRTWKPFGRPVSPGDECKVVERADGSWMLNSRWRAGARRVYLSRDRGATWAPFAGADLADPGCNGQLERVGDLLLFTNCKSSVRRENLTLRVSADGGATWSDGVTVCPTASMYSDFTRLSNGDIGILYEEGDLNIRFKAVSGAWTGKNEENK